MAPTKPLEKKEAETRLRAKDWTTLRAALQRLPGDVDAALAGRVVLEQLGTGHYAAWTFGRHCQRVPPHVIREVLRLLSADSSTPERLFLREAVDSRLLDAALTRAWVLALESLLDLSLTYSWGSRQRRERFKALAKNPLVVSAIQAAVVGSEDPPIDMLAVLAVEGSDASIDALLPVFSKGDADSRLEKLAVHAAKTPAMRAMLEAITSRRVKKEAGSSAVAFVSNVLGLAEPLEAVKFRIYLSSVESETGGVPLIQGSLSVDSKRDQWWSVELTRVDREMSMKHSSFGVGERAEDALRVGKSSLEELPTWVVKAGKKLAVTWNRDAFFSGSLRGKKRDQVVAWLFSRS